MANTNFPPVISPADLKYKFPSYNKPLLFGGAYYRREIYISKSPQKSPVKNISPGAYIRNFTVSKKQHSKRVNKVL